MSKVKEAVLAIFLTLFALSTFAQTGSVRGRIIDAKTISGVLGYIASQK